MDLTELKTDKDGKLPMGLDFTVFGDTLGTKAGRPVKISAEGVAKQLGAAAYLDDYDDDWAKALQRAQYEKKREVLQRYVRGVLVFVDDDGEKQVELDMAIPLSVEFPASFAVRVSASSSRA